MRQSTPAAVISSSNAARCSGGMIGSSAPICTSTLAFTAPACAGFAVPRPEWKPTTAFRGSPARAISSTVVPPKQ